ncbi:hypothetical protein F511_35734 [Dorcoceras hygrometricum]|uniref:Uncharacterized protein n=1 Tax=Dorcoceras hygrometricum TaxID=472368 RepID=A0A2Z7AAT5_9LAMI|nr:hypothetical protein F511_35734 [Dorcoceras hygrometricum]
MSASGESSTTMHRLLHASGSHPIPTPYDPKRVGKRVKVRRLSCRVSMTFRVVRTNQYNQDLRLIHSTNGNHLESPNEGSLIDHPVTIYLHAQNITMLPTNETCSRRPRRRAGQKHRRWLFLRRLLPPLLSSLFPRLRPRGGGRDAPPPFDPSKDSLVASPSAVMATRYICNMAPNPDLDVVAKAEDVKVIGQFSAHIALAIVWGGEMVKRLTRAHRRANASRQKFDEALGRHAEVLARLEELEGFRAREEEEARSQREALEAELLAEREARVAEKEAMRAELEEAKTRSEQEVERLKGEAREEFLKSSEFDVLLGKRSFSYFKDGFWGCLAQFRAHGYSEEEHPASFLDLQQDLMKLGDEEEEREEDQEEGEVGDDAEGNPPPS